MALRSRYSSRFLDREREEQYETSSSSDAKRLITFIITTTFF